MEGTGAQGKLAVGTRDRPAPAEDRPARQEAPAQDPDLADEGDRGDEQRPAEPAERTQSLRSLYQTLPNSPRAPADSDGLNHDELRYVRQLIADGPGDIHSERGEPPADSLPRRKEMFKLPTFDGQYKEFKEVNAFMQRVRDYMSVHGITGRASVIALYACFRSNSPAGVWFAKTVPGFVTLDDFETAFRQRFKLSASEAVRATERLNSFRQRPQDTVIAYHTGLIAVYDQLELLGIEYSDAQKFAKFLSGIDPHLRSACAPALETIPDCDLSKLLSVAMAIEGARTGPRRNERSSTPQFRAMQTHQTTRRCNFCRKRGHLWDDCPRIAELKKNGKWEERPQQRSSRS